MLQGIVFSVDCLAIVLIGLFLHFSVRRGWEVYKQVCAACHSLK